MRISGFIDHSEEFILPSKGHAELYGDMIPGGRGTIRPLTTKEEKVLYGGFSQENLNRILNEIVSEPEGFDADKLIPADQVYLNYKMRIVTYGSSYKVDLQCQSCGILNKEVIVDLDSLEVTYLDENFKQPIEITLPRSQDKLHINPLLTAERLDLIRSRSEKLSGDLKVPRHENEYILRLCYYIVKVNDEVVEDPEENRQYVESMQGMDSTYILNEVRKWMDFGLEDITTLNCANCNQSMQVVIPITLEFFRPTYFGGV